MEIEGLCREGCKNETKDAKETHVQRLRTIEFKNIQ
jgi:hypothetical protein